MSRIKRLLALQKHWEESGGQPEHGPFFRSEAKLSLNKLQPIFEGLVGIEVDSQDTESGYRSSYFLFRAIDICARYRLPMPDWVATAFASGVHKIINGETGSLDQAFGRIIAKGRHFNSLKNEANRLFQVRAKVAEAKASNPKTAIDRELFELIGMAITPPCSGAEAEKLWCKGVRALGQPDLEYFKNPPF